MNDSMILFLKIKTMILVCEVQDITCCLIAFIGLLMYIKSTLDKSEWMCIFEWIKERF